MRSLRLYYLLKPYLPRRLRLALRRISANRKRRAYAHLWPISHSAALVPKNWSGWPDGKQFALVLTHDVEGVEGLAQSRQLAELEMRHNVRSSFNFVPEGTYTTPAEMRRFLVDHGFEVGVHDFNHDGHLFSSLKGFHEKSAKINRYLAEWNSVGFRSGFMLRNTDWIQQLNVVYDSSTFDTDPFEPQPEGFNTIFPFWMPTPGSNPNGFAANPGSARAKGGYVELPYTLAQDSTLFFVLGETSPEIWIRKLDWIAERGGMALVNVHPDYIDFQNARGSRWQYPAEHYSMLLRYVAQRYEGRFWNPLPRELAAWYLESNNRSVGARTDAAPADAEPGFEELRGKDVAVLLYSNYPSDPRPRRAAEALAHLGMNVEVICIKQQPSEPDRESVNGVNVRRLSIQHKRGGALGYLWQYSYMLIASFLILAKRASGKRYSLVHVHNMPDVLVFGSLIPKLGGAKVILDLHDPMPELMRTIFGIKESSFGTSVLKFLEKLSIGFSDAVLTVNLACKNIFSARSCRPEKIHVVMNAPDEEIFRFRPATESTNREGRFVIMYHGSLVERHGLDLAVDALRRIKGSIPGAELRIYGQETPFLTKVLKSLEGSELAGSVHYLGPRKLDGIVAAIEDCDVGIIPNRRSIFTEINTPTRIFEYLSKGKPVVAPRAQGIRDYFGEDELVYFELGDAADLARQLEFVHREPEAVVGCVKKGQAVYLNHRWRNERMRFTKLVADLLGAGVSHKSEQVSEEPVATEIER